MAAIADQLRDADLAVGVGVDDNGNPFVNAIGAQSAVREAARELRSTYPNIDIRSYRTSIYVRKGSR
jgi:hypothetical protein